MTSPLLEVGGLNVDIASARGRLRAVDDVSFEVMPGEALALVGESGCGKTMTLRSLMGLLPPQAHIAGGSVRLEGTELTTLREAELNKLRGARVSMIFQEPMTALNPVMRVGEQIAEGPRAHLGMSPREARERAVEVLAMVGVPEPRRRLAAYPHELSGGMRQRVMIAIAVSCRPALILCDEPTTALDVTIQDQVLRLLQRLCREMGVALVFVTHDLAVVAQTCRRVCVMYAGQIVERGTVQQVFAEPRHPYTLGLLRSVPDFDRGRRDLESIPGQPPDPASPPAGCRFRPRCPFAEDDCARQPIPLIELEGGRAAACLHHDRCAAEAHAHPVIHRG
jgi:oligopeptide/dipeptide ABC transporter ATP-binding protein